MLVLAVAFERQAPRASRHHRPPTFASSPADPLHPTRRLRATEFGPPLPLGKDKDNGRQPQDHIAIWQSGQVRCNCPMRPRSSGATRRPVLPTGRSAEEQCHSATPLAVSQPVFARHCCAQGRPVVDERRLPIYCLNHPSTNKKDMQHICARCVEPLMPLSATPIQVQIRAKSPMPKPMSRAMGSRAQVLNPNTWHKCLTQTCALEPKWQTSG